MIVPASHYFRLTLRRKLPAIWYQVALPDIAAALIDATAHTQHPLGICLDFKEQADLSRSFALADWIFVLAERTHTPTALWLHNFPHDSLVSWYATAGNPTVALSVPIGTTTENLTSRTELIGMLPSSLEEADLPPHHPFTAFYLPTVYSQAHADEVSAWRRKHAPYLPLVQPAPVHGYAKLRRFPLASTCNLLVRDDVTATYYGALHSVLRERNGLAPAAFTKHINQEIGELIHSYVDHK